MLSHHDLLVALADELSPRAITSLRILAAVVLVTLLCGLFYVLRNLRDLKADRGGAAETPLRRANYFLIFIACAVMFLAACVFLFLVAKAGSPI